MKLPPRWIRRIFLWPLPVILSLLYLGSVPLLLIIAFIWSYKMPGKLRAVRSLGLFSVYVFVEAALIVSAFGLWIASGFGWKLRSERFQTAHYALLRWALKVLVGAGQRLFALEIELNRGAFGPSADGENEPLDAPLIIMSRHAGPADSILLLHGVMSGFRHRPRVVMKDALQWDPAFDIMLNRVPNRFVTHGSGTSTAQLVGEMAAGMRPNDAFVIFPEGGNFTERRRERAIAHFEERSQHDLAERARGLTRTLPPRPGGTLAALQACPEAAAVFVAHTGLDHIEGIRDLWDAIPDHKVVHAVWQAIPPEDVPDDVESQTEMLWSAWEIIDSWIGLVDED